MQIVGFLALIIMAPLIWYLMLWIMCEGVGLFSTCTPRAQQYALIGGIAVAIAGVITIVFARHGLSQYKD